MKVGLSSHAGDPGMNIDDALESHQESSGILVIEAVAQVPGYLLGMRPRPFGHVLIPILAERDVSSKTSPPGPLSLEKERGSYLCAFPGNAGLFAPLLP